MKAALTAIAASWLLLSTSASSEQVPLGPVIDDETNLESEEWEARTTTFSPNRFQERPYVANGYFGQSIPSEGAGYWIDRNASSGQYAVNGWPMDQPRATFGTITGFWGLIPRVTRPILDDNVKRGWESVISGIPDWTGLEVTMNGQTYRPGIDPESVKSYSQSQNFRNGIVRTNVTWQPDDSNPTTLKLCYTVLAHRKFMNLGLVRLDVEASGDTSIGVADVLDGDGATLSVLRSQGIIDGDRGVWVSVSPRGVHDVTAYIASSVSFTEDGDSFKSVKGNVHPGSDFANASTISQHWRLALRSNEPVTIIKHVGISSSEHTHDAFDTAVQTASAAAEFTWEDLIDSHKAEWENVWDGADIVTPGNAELTRVSRSSLFHLLSNIRDGFDNSMMVGGLSSDSYAGLIFWDADTWMFPPLLLFRRDYAKGIVQYRRRLLDQAKLNSQFYNYSGALYPWTSARYGNCTGTGLCQHYQYHLNSDIALSAWQYYQHTLDETWLRDVGWPLIEQAANMFAAYVVRNESRGGQYETIRMGEPDEYVWNVNNGAFTNAGIKQLLGNWAPQAAEVLDISPGGNWSTIADNLVIPYDPEEKLIHEFDNMPGTIEIKQASVALINYPLDYRISLEQAHNDLDYYGTVTSPNGPAMTWSIFAISSAQLQRSGCGAYTYLTQAYKPYLRAPFYQFSEQAEDDPRLNGGISPAFPFLTGHGGFLQILTHGIAGFRSSKDAFVLDPMLIPHVSESVQLRGLKWQGAVFDVDVGLEETTITRRHGGSDSPVPVLVTGFHRYTESFQLRVGQKATVSTRRPDLSEPVVQGNLVQCSAASSTTAHISGHGPMAAVDGTMATVWQPLASNETSELIIEMGRGDKVNGFDVNWGNAPPQSFSMAVRKDRQNVFRTIYDNDNVAISEPYKGAEDARKVKLRAGNSTSHTFDEPYAGVEQIKLSIFGSQGQNEEVGATVAEIMLY